MQANKTKVQFQNKWVKTFDFDYQPGDYKSHFFDQNSKDVMALKAKLGFPNEDSMTLHHIFPGNKLRVLLQACRKQSDDKVQKVCNYLDAYCNGKQSIAQPVMNFISKQDPKSALQFCWAALYWNRNNLVLGPKNRSDDPKNSVDQPLLSKQTNKTYIQTMKELIQLFEKKDWNGALKKFIDLSLPNNVEWAQKTNPSSVPKKYYVKSNSNLKANQGFSYY